MKMNKHSQMKDPKQSLSTKDPSNLDVFDGLYDVAA